MFPAPEKLVTVLLFASRAVALMLNDTPVDWVGIFPPPAASTRKLFNAPGCTVKLELAGPDVVPSPAVIVVTSAFVSVVVRVVVD